MSHRSFPVRAALVALLLAAFTTMLALVAPAPAQAAPSASTVLAKQGSRNGVTREMQGFLRTLNFYPYAPDGRFGPVTKTAVTKFQRSVGLPANGIVDLRTYRAASAAAAKRAGSKTPSAPAPSGPVKLDARCLSGARVICVDKTTRKLHLVTNGRITKTMDARFGGPTTPTREGQFSITYKSRNHVSREYAGASMPFALFFSRGQAVHYSPGFARVGWAGASKGCVNLRDYAGARWLFDTMRVGDKVVVFRS